MLWTQQYTPKSLSEFSGNDESVSKLKHFILNKTVVMIHGPVGSGKTCSVHALASELGYEIIEINASDFRNKNAINDIIKSSLEQQSLFNKGKIILIDEIDGIEGNADRGGVQALSRLLGNKQHALVMTANNPWDKKFTPLRKKSTILEFKTPNYLHVYSVLKRICQKESLQCDDDALKEMAGHSNGDIRGAINDLQGLTEQTKKLTIKDLDTLGYREREESIFNALQLVFKSKDINKVISAFDAVNADLKEAFLWIDENIPREYHGPNMYAAFESLGKADIYNHRILRWQYWRFLVYVNFFLTVGINLAKTESSEGFTSYKRTTRILKLWLANQRYAKRKSIALSLILK
jgi:replication factor C large subunit